jgi:acetyl esterase/lipase
VLALAPAGDFVDLHDQQGCGGIMPALMGGSPSTVPDRYRAASPGALLPIGVPQAIVIADRDERFEGFGRAYAKKAMMAGDQVRVVDAHGAGHFDVIAPVTPTWQTVRHALDDLFNRI